MGKASVSNITVSHGFVIVPKALAMAVCRLWLARSRSFLLPPPGSVRWHHTALLAGTLLLNPPQASTLLLPTGWHPTTTHRLAHYRYSPAGTLLLLFRLVDPSSVTPSRGIALPPWLLSNALDPCNDLHDRTSGYSGPTVSVFSLVDDRPSTPLMPAFQVFEQAVSYILGSLRKGLGLSTGTFLCIVSLRVWGILS